MPGAKHLLQAGNQSPDVFLGPPHSVSLLVPLSAGRTAEPQARTAIQHESSHAARSPAPAGGGGRRAARGPARPPPQLARRAPGAGAYGGRAPGGGAPGARRRRGAHLGHARGDRPRRHAVQRRAARLLRRPARPHQRGTAKCGGRHEAHAGLHQGAPLLLAALHARRAQNRQHHNHCGPQQRRGGRHALCRRHASGRYRSRGPLLHANELQEREAERVVRRRLAVGQDPQQLGLYHAVFEHQRRPHPLEGAPARGRQPAQRAAHDDKGPLFDQEVPRARRCGHRQVPVTAGLPSMSSSSGAARAVVGSCCIAAAGAAFFWQSHTRPARALTTQ
ncbi:hypothetical protein Rsub_08374 [Raphidocelis subcapitata]|uniref:Uncharacterized protein n=1 Tax=Raphidocelis subcapitata TaxID=307507 RepID=A0A2V0P8Y9_9CHLO|nr:hypothetical protein Rsub_08374 [Raphidocelis subcapitata]|eukprot:GBF95412.1 hypothetical protein Rsub_08374 [Raphidocelis subcapitata]